MAKELDLNKLETLRLDPAQIQLHQRRIQRALAKTVQTTFKILDTCRADNGGILARDFASSKLQQQKLSYFLAFVPAAGAASRYFGPLGGLRHALLEQDRSELAKELESLRKQEAKTWALPAPLPHLLSDASAVADLSVEAMQALLTAIDAPKALQPCTEEGHTYLQLKGVEHQNMQGLCGQAFIVPPGRSEEFRQDLAKSGTTLPAAFLEQGAGLSTIRFKNDGSPYVTEEGQYSVVPAGHGTLVQLFSLAKQQFPTAEALFIRNIDNVAGFDEEIQEATATFLRLYSWIFQEFKSIRAALAQNDLTAANAAAEELAAAAASLPKSPAAKTFMAMEKNQTSLRTVLVGLLQMDERPLLARLAKESPVAVFKELFDRPLNLLGQVPNIQRDVGGTPVYVETSHGVQKVCLELPHASSDDVKNFLAHPAKATHFNPVFVAAELVADSKAYDAEDNVFWIMAAKSFQGEPVVYHETVLYELLGNNFLANALFVEVPRRVFQPHKTLSDTRGKRFAHWVDPTVYTG